MDFMDIRDEIKKRRKESWLEVWFSIEVLGIDENIAKTRFPSILKNYLM